MTSDHAFETCREQLFLISEWMSANRAASSFEDREAKLKAACEQAILSLRCDLKAISDLEQRLVEHHHDLPRDSNERQTERLNAYAIGSNSSAQRI